MGGLIREAIDSVSPGGGRACDLFAGSGAVSLSLSQSRDVTAVDIQEYSRVICDAQLKPAALTEVEINLHQSEIISSPLYESLLFCLEPLIDFEREAASDAKRGIAESFIALIEAQPLLFATESGLSMALHRARETARRRLVDKGLWDSRTSTVTRYFGGVYFSFAQAAYMDAAMALAKLAAPHQMSTFESAVLSTASTLVNTIGKQFAQPIRPRAKDGAVKLTVAAAASRDRSVDAAESHGKWLRQYASLARTNRSHEAIRGDYLEILATKGPEFAVVYADPPYTRDHYSRFYHVLETMCLRDEPKISITSRNGVSQPSRGVYREARHQSPFCVRSTAPDAFEQLFRESKRFELPLVLSYSPSEEGDGTHPRVMSASQVTGIARRFYQSVEVQYVVGKTHNKHNRADLDLVKREHAEMLVVCSS